MRTTSGKTGEIKALRIMIMSKLLLAVLITTAHAAYGQPCGVSGMVVQLRHDINLPPGSLTGLPRLAGGDEGAPNGKGFSWSMLSIPVRPADGFKLPAGVVFGLKHSMHQAKVNITVLGNDPVKGPGSIPGFSKQNGGDWSAPKGQGFYWYETTGEGFTDSDWANVDRLNLLPKGTVIGLKNSRNQPKKKLTWKGKVYDPVDKTIAPPEGFERRFGGDLGLPSGQGFYWYEKTVGCDAAGKGGGGE
jgi:hypothetical protein